METTTPKYFDGYFFWLSFTLERSRSLFYRREEEERGERREEVVRYQYKP
jgi:hypothetical protein